MRPILIQGQMDIETDFLFAAISDSEMIEYGNAVYYSGTLHGYPCVMMNAHFGQANAAMNTALAIHRWKPCFVINQGTAGGHADDLYVGDVVLAEKVVNINSFKTPPKGIGGGSNSLEWEPFFSDIWIDGRHMETLTFEPDPKLYELACTFVGKRESYQIKSGVIGSGDCWNEERDRIQKFTRKYHTACEEMEFFSVAQVCAALHTRWIGFRVLTNSIVTNGGSTRQRLASAPRKSRLILLH